MRLLPGDIIAVRGTGFIAETIEKITHSQYSHVCIYIGLGVVVEAQGMRPVGHRNLSDYEGTYDVYRSKQPLASGQVIRIDDFLNAKVGDQYDYVDIFVLLLRYLFNLRLPWREAKRYICSMLVLKAYRSAGIRLCVKENVSPEDIIESDKLYKVTE